MRDLSFRAKGRARRDVRLWARLRERPKLGRYPRESTRSDAMHAEVGDRLVIKGHHVGEPDRDAEILEVRGDDGSPPFFVRWDDDGHEGLFFPGADATVEHFPHRRAR